MKDCPLISVVIPAYNVEQYVQKCIQSICEQSEQNLEILIYDDGSTDDTFRIIERYKNERMKIFRGEQNRGVVYARNFLLDRAAGDFIAFQDADDWSHKDRLKMQLKYLTSTPQIGGCGTQFVKMVESRPAYYSNFSCNITSIKEAIPKTFEFLPGSIMVRKSALTNAGYYHPFFGNDGNEDLYYISKIALTSGLGNVNAHLYYYRLNLNSLTKLSGLNKRRIYIHELNTILLQELIETGTNALEAGDVVRLNAMETKYAASHKHVKPFQVFEKVIGQLIYYHLYRLAMKEILRYALITGDVIRAGRLFIYVARKSFRYEG